jgi:hypothetical protein
VRPLIYLASPYSGTAEQQHDRYIEIVKAAAYFMNEGHNIFCPIAHTHPLYMHSTLLKEKNGHWWLDQDFGILKHCNQLWVYMMDGYKESFGVNMEQAYARSHNIPVVMVEPLKWRLADDTLVSNTRIPHRMGVGLGREVA